MPGPMVREGTEFKMAWFHGCPREEVGADSAPVMEIVSVEVELFQTPCGASMPPPPAMGT